MNNTMRLIAGIALPSMLAFGALSAQTVSSPAPATSTPSNNDQIVQLQEFEVNESSPNGYIASETMTGSRVNTKILDLPYSIVNLTQEFFHDYNVEILDENMTYIGGLTGINIGGSFNLRGFSSTSQLRDGFYRLGRYGLSNIQEVEIIRGPNAAIYGRSSPGGMINFISLPPEKQDEQTLDISQGGYDQYRDNLHMTGSVDQAGSTYYVVDVNQTGRSYPGGDSHIRNNEDFIAIKHDFSEDASLLVSAEYFLQVQHAPQGAPPIESVAVSAIPAGQPGANSATSRVVGYDLPLGYLNPYGPNSELNRGSGTFEAIYTQRYNDHWSSRLGLYRFGARRWDYDQNNGWPAFTVSATGATTISRGSVPSRGEIMEDGGGFQQDVVGDYKLFGDKIESKSLLTVDLNDYYRWDPTWEYSTVASTVYGVGTDPVLTAWSTNRVVTLVPGTLGGKQGLVPSGPINYFPTWYDPAKLVIFGAGNSITGGPAEDGGTLTRRRTTSLGGNLREQIFALNQRLILYAGLRTDNVLFSQRDYTVAFNSVGFGYVPPGTGGPLQADGPGGSVVRRYEHQNKPDAGFSYLVLPSAEGGDSGLRVYGSYSTAYFVDQTSRPSVIASSTYAPFTARGWDYGIKGSYFASRLNFTLGGYYDNEYNVLVSDTVQLPNGSFTDEPEQDGNQLVRGWESDASWVVLPDDSLTIGESFGHVDARYISFGSAYPEAVGRPASGITPDNGSAYLKYNFLAGPLRGLYANALVTYVAATPTQAPNAGDTTTIENGVSVVTGSTYLWQLKIPSFTLWTFALHYELPRWSNKWDQQISITLNNAFNKQYLKTSALIGDSRNVIFEYQISHF